MIVTVDEVKTLARFTGTDATRDAYLLAIIPYVQEDLCEYLNNYFQDNVIYRLGANINFVKGDPDTITDDASEFVEDGFVAGMDIAVESAGPNNGIYELDTVTAGTLTLTTSNELVSISAGEDLGWVKMSNIAWPKPLKLVVAQMCSWLFYNPRPDDLQQENIDGTQIVRAGAQAYPLRILNMAEQYRRPRFA